MGSRMGYEYRYRFGIDDEIISRYGAWYSESWRLDTKYLFEIRTNFIVRKRSDDGEIILIDSERYDTGATEDDTEGYLEVVMGYRLKDYWMTDDEIRKLIRKALSFARAADPQHASYRRMITIAVDKIQELFRKALSFGKERTADPQHTSYRRMIHPQHTSYRRMIPIAVDLDVCTVQQEGEPIDATIDRAIRAEYLLPLDMVQINQASAQASTRKDRKPLELSFRTFLREELSKVRVEDIDKGLSLMEECPICLREPTIGALISSLDCNHAFHYHCIVRWLEKSRSCPMCRQRAHNFMSFIESFLENVNL